MSAEGLEERNKWLGVKCCVRGMRVGGGEQEVRGQE